MAIFWKRQRPLSLVVALCYAIGWIHVPSVPLLVSADTTEHTITVLVSVFPLKHNGDTAYYFHCYGGSDESIFECCDAMERSAIALKLKSFESASCPRHLTLLPSRKTAVDDERLLPTHAWMHSLNKTAAGGSWFFPPVEDRFLKQGDHRSFLWNDETRQIRELTNTGEEGAPGGDRSLFLPYSKENQKEGAFSACVESSLSGSGMHQDLHHRVNLKFPEVPKEAFELSLDLLVHLPADLFINIEDAVFIHQDNFHVSLVTVHPIDQEEPTFVSPPHAFAIHIASKAPTTALSLDLTTKLHFRYPPPQRNDNFWRIVVPPPLVTGGSVGVVPTQTWTLASSHCAEEYPVILWAAVGHPEDHPSFLIATQVVALLGAAVMMRDIARVAKWR